MSASGDAASAIAAGVVYRRVLLKLSGEALMGVERFGIDPGSLQAVARGVASSVGWVSRSPS